MIRSRLAWMVLGAGVSALTRRQAERSIAVATQQLDDLLPASVSRVAGVMPGDLLRVGGVTIVVGNAAMTAGKVVKVAAGATGVTFRVGRRVAGRAGDGKRTLDRRRAELDSIIAEVTAAWRHETESERRRLRSEMLGVTRGDAAALEARLDLRWAGSDREPLPEMRAPVPRGRIRRTIVVAPLVDRVQRTYRPPRRPWDEPVRPTLRPGSAPSPPGQRDPLSG